MRKTSSYIAALIMLLLTIGLGVVRAQTFTVLYNFGVNPGDLSKPVTPATVAQGRDGSMYSTTPNGGTSNLGGLFKITPTGEFTTLYNFDGIHGAEPYSGLTLGEDGNLYGATLYGGETNDGVIFKINTSGVLSVLHNFSGADGVNPYAPPILGADGNFYGTTFAGGNEGDGTIYRISPEGQFKSLYSFLDSSAWRPYAALVQGTNGVFYGTTEWGGNGGGTVFKITPNGEFTNLHNLGGTDGEFPYAPLVQATDGLFYGTTEEGGTNNTGVIFRMSPSGAFTVLHNFNFNGNPGGSASFDGLVQATDGNLYGDPSEGGTFGFGTIYCLAPAGFSVLYNFNSPLSANPESTLLQHTTGIFYGQTTTGGSADFGTFYSLDTGLGSFASVVPGAGRVGKTVGVLGQGFAGATQVSFNGVPAKFKVIEDTFLGAIVPARAKTGFVTVTTPSGVLKSNRRFLVIP